MISRSQLACYQSPQPYPAVSIIAPTHRTAPANKQDPIKVKNLLTKAIDRLHKEFKKREVADLVKKLKQLVKEVDWQHTLEGLALFASNDTAASLNVPFKVKPRVVIGETFATRDLKYAMNRLQPYRVLLLSHTGRLFDAWGSVLEEHAGPFPFEHGGPGGGSKLPGGIGVNVSGKRDDAMRAFYRKVDAAVEAVQKSDPLPLVLAGADRSIAYYLEVAKRPDAVAGILSGNHDKTPLDKLGKLTLDVYEQEAARRRTKGLVQLDDAVSASAHSSGIQQVWRTAVDDKVDSLFVERGFKYPADLAEDGYLLTPHQGAGRANLDDAVDEVIEKVLATGGKVFFYYPGDLDVHQSIAAIVRRG